MRTQNCFLTLFKTSYNNSSTVPVSSQGHLVLIKEDLCKPGCTALLKTSIYILYFLLFTYKNARHEGQVVILPYPVYCLINVINLSSPPFCFILSYFLPHHQINEVHIRMVFAALPPLYCCNV